jgi:hypothetical protein
MQQAVAHALGWRMHQVSCECRRMGGGFGGKESQSAQWACIAALLARASGRPVKLRLDRDDDMRATGKRHDFRIDYDVGFDAGRPHHRPAPRARLPLRLLGRPVGPGQRPRGVPRRQRLLPRRGGHPQPALPHPHGVEHRLPRLRRAPGHVRHRIGARRHRPPPGPRPAGGAPRQLLRRAGAQLTPYGMRVEDTIIAPLVGPPGRATPTTPGAAPRSPPSTPQPGAQARAGAHPGEVRHLLHQHLPQPGRRAGACVQGRQRAGQPRRHRDGPGPLHQGAPDRRRRVRPGGGRRAPVGHRHQPRAQHLGHRRLVGQRPQRQGRPGRLPGDPRAAGGLRRRRLGREAERALRGRPRARPRLRRPLRPGRATPGWPACSCGTPASTPPPSSATTPAPCAAGPSTTSPTAPR